MSTKETVVSTVAAETPVSHHEIAQKRLQELRFMREQIPRFLIPEAKGDFASLVSAASVSPEFVELTTVAVANHNALVRGEALTPAEVRDLMSYADAYDPFADELEAFAQFVRFSTAAARNKAGSEALTTYALAQRLAKRPETADLAPHVADMRRALGRTRKAKPEAVAKKAAEEAVKATEKAEKAAKKAAEKAAKSAAKP